MKHDFSQVTGGGGGGGGIPNEGHIYICAPPL